MSGLGELIIYLIYGVLGLGFVVFLILTGSSRSQTRRGKIGLALFFGLLLLGFKYCQDSNYRSNQMEHVGIYYLTNYPDCDSCYIELTADMRYKIVNKGRQVEQGDWHHESGGDYFITYLNGDQDQLGSGKYAFRKFIKKRPE